MSVATISAPASVEYMDAVCINTIRTSMDAVQAANSGHPGTPMALAPLAYCLWQKFLRFDPQDPVLPPHITARVSVEEASDFGWSKYTVIDGHNICIETFGASAPIKQLLKKFGFSAQNVVAAVKAQIKRHADNPSQRA